MYSLFTQILTNAQLVGLLLVVLINLSFGFYIFLKAPNGAMNRIFLGLTTSIALWSLATFLTVFFYSNVYIYDLSDRFTYLFGLIIALSFYLFSISYPYKGHSISSKYIYAYIFAMLIFGYFAFFTDLFVTSAYLKDGFVTTDHNPITYIIYSLVILSPFILGMHELKSKLNNGDGIYKQHFLTLIILVGSSIALSLFFNLFLASFSNYDYIVVGPLSSIFLSFAIMRMIVSKE